MLRCSLYLCIQMLKLMQARSLVWKNYLTFWIFFTVNTDLKITYFQSLRELDIVFLYSQ